MKNKKIQISAIIVCVLVILGMITLTFIYIMQNDKYVKYTAENNVTRYEWLQMLCNQFGIEPDTSGKPYFVDVEEDNLFYGYVQSSVSWGLIYPNGKFDGDEPASGMFIALTGMKAMGEYKVKIYLNQTNEIKDNEYLQIVQDEEIVSKKQMHESFTKQECQNILNKFSLLYTEGMWKESVSQINYKEGVIELEELDIVSYISESQIEISEETAKSLSKGNIVVFSQENSDMKIARKITDIKQEILTMEEVDMEQVLDSMIVSDISTISLEDILQYNNITEPISSDMSCNMLFMGEEGKSANVSDIVNDEGFSISIDYSADVSEEATATIKDNTKDISYIFPIDFGEVDEDNKCDIKAEINIDEIMIGAQIIYTSDNKIQYIDVQTESNMTVSGEIEMEGEKTFKVFETPTPLGGGIVGVNFELYLVINANGNVSLKVQIPVKNKICYEKNKGFRRYRYPVDVEEPEIAVNCEARLFDRIEPVITILDIYDVLDAELDFGVSADADIANHTANPLICADVDISFPIITLTISGDDKKSTLLQKMKLSTKWEIITEDNAPWKKALHYEKYVDDTGAFVDKCTYNADSKEVLDEKNNEEQVPEGDRLTEKITGNHNVYITKYADTNMVSAPKFQFEYPDNWTISSEIVNGENNIGEEVVLTNARGVTITFVQLRTAVTNYSRIMNRAIVTKVANASFVPSWVSGTDYSDLGIFMVAKIKVNGYLMMDTDSDFKDEDGAVYYAVIQESFDGQELCMRPCADFLDAPDCVFFEYPDAYAFYADSPDGGFTEAEERDVVQILSSFSEFYGEE